MKKDNKKRKKQFYKNKNRNAHWTEEPKGREIDFADKYVYDGNASDKYTEAKRRAHENAIRAKAKRQTAIKRILIVLLCIALISIGYTSMDIYMTRHAVPVENIKNNNAHGTVMNELDLALKATQIDSLSLDGSIMLQSIIDNTLANGYNSVVFDAKRVDGTIGYTSTLASIDTYSAVSNASSNPKASIKALSENDILPVARISCYRDNVVPAQNPNMALMIGDKYYTNDDSTYLSPNSNDAYCYIRDIIRELNTYGVTVFVLSECDLPNDISDKYNDGFDTLSAKLTNDLGTGIKFVEEVKVEIKGKDAETGKTTNSAIKKDIKGFDKLGDNQIYYISTKLSDDRVAQQLSESNITSYIIGE